MKCLAIVLCIGVKSYFISLTLLNLSFFFFFFFWGGGGGLYLTQVQFKLNTSIKYISNVSNFYLFYFIFISFLYIFISSSSARCD